MRTFPLQAGRHRSPLHQKNWEVTFAQSWRRWRLRWARHAQRKALRNLADDPHLLADIGVTREQALEEAGRSIFDMSEIRIHRYY